MPTRKPKEEDAAELVQDLEGFRRPLTNRELQRQPAKMEPRKTRSKRGVLRTDPNTTQLCFRVETPKHTALKAYCVTHRREIAEVMDELLTRFLISVQNMPNP